MSLYPSLKSNKYKDKRSLLLQQKWDKEHNSIYGLPKEKIIRYKIKKEKEKKKEVTPITEYTTSINTKKGKKKSKDIGKIK